MSNQFVLGSIKNDKIGAIHLNGFPVKYWPNGPGTYSGGPGWYYWDDDDEGCDEGFCHYPLDDSPWDYPIFQVWDTEYRSLVLLVIVPMAKLDFNLWAKFAPVKPYTAEQIKAFLEGWEQ